MCGIAGIAGGAPPEAAALERMAATMAHRGPDGQGVWSDDDAGLAFRRLAIIDLDPRSDQPLHLEHSISSSTERSTTTSSCAGSCAARATASTEGDGEVLLHAWLQWGEGALERVNGMFAFGVWDSRERSLTLASDPFGEKPRLLDDQ